MKKWMALFACAVLVFTGCGRQEVLVDSGTYEGTVLKVNPDEVEVYVALDEKRVLELYFSESTTVSSANETASFDALQKGQRVRVEVTRTGDEMVPVSVQIME
jgi:hypothetical protein